MYTALFHEIWHEPLIEAVSPQPGEKILVLGPNSTSLAISLAQRFRESRFTAVDSLQESIDRGRRRVGDLEVAIQLAAANEHLPFAALTFDKVISALALYQLSAEQKLECVREARRALRRNGTLFAAEFDKPTARGESAVFDAMIRSDSIAAAKTHTDGSWVSIFDHAGFTNVRSLFSHSVQFGRVLVVKGRKL